MQHVTQIQYNLKGAPTTRALDRLTLIVGPNGSGKSAIVNAVELALTGKASDLQGRALVAQDAALASLTSASVAYAEATLSGGGNARWEGKAQGRATRTGPEGLFPLRDVVANLTGSADRARKFLLGHAAADVTQERILAGLPADLHEQYTQACQRSLSPAENLQHIATQAAKCARDASKRAEGSAAASEAAAHGLGPAAPSDETYEAQRAAVAAAQVAYTAARDALVYAKSWQPPAVSTDDLNAQIAELQQNIGTVQAALEVMEAKPQDPDGMLALREGLRRVIGYNQTADACIACSTPQGADWEDKRAYSARTLVRLDGMLAEAQETLNLMNQYRAGIRRGQGTLGMLQAQRAALATYPPAPEHSVEAAQQMVDELAEEHRRQANVLEDMVRSRAAWDRVKAARRAQRAAEREAATWKALEGACKTLTDDLVQDAVGRFISRVQRYLPEGDTFALKMGKTTCKVGLWRERAVVPGDSGPNIVLHTALSGAEWARVTAAVACACTADEAEVAVLVPEDRAWDAKTLRDVLKALGNFPGQVLVATTIKPYRGVPAGWTTIELDDNA